MRKIGFIGTFEVANYGDCLFPVVYMNFIAKRLPGCAFSFYSPRSGVCPLADYGPVQGLPDRLERLHFEADQLILCGGETLSLGHSAGTYNFPASTLSAYARMWLGPVIAASRGDLEFFVHCVGMPTKDLETKSTIARLLGYANRVSVRDQVSCDRLEGRYPVEVDPVFALSTCHEADWWQARARQFLPDTFQVGEYISAHLSATYLSESMRPWCEQVAKVAQDNDLPVLLLPICHFLHDRKTLETARAILIELGLPADRVQFPAPGHQEVTATAALLGGSAGVITSSLHAIVTAVSFGVPFAGFVGTGSATSKQRQTLLAAGVPFGISPTIAEIAATFQVSLAQDMESVRRNAIDGALRDFDALWNAMNAPSESRSLVPPSEIDEAITIDRLATKNVKRELKRTILRWSKNIPVLDWLLRMLRQYRISQKA